MIHDFELRPLIVYLMQEGKEDSVCSDSNVEQEEVEEAPKVEEKEEAEDEDIGPSLEDFKP